MTLYKKVKELLPEAKSVISDDEFLMVGRKDYHMSQVSGVNALLMTIDANCGYPYRVLLAFLEQFAANCPTEDFNVVLADPGLALGAFSVWTRAGGSATAGKIYAPKGLPRFPELPGLAGEIVKDFHAAAIVGPTARPTEERHHVFTFVLGNTKTSEQTLFAVDRFVEANEGLLILKDYAKVDAADEREYLESKRVFPSITFEGHAFALKTVGNRRVDQHREPTPTATN